MHDAARPTLLEARGIDKSFGGIHALRNVSLSISPGEVLAVVGENGAGKSTLMRILAGIEHPDRATILLDDQPIHLRTAQDAISAGIALIHQELNLAGNLDVGANIYLGHEPRRAGFIDHRAIRRLACTYLSRVGLDIDPATLVDDLTVAKRQLVEIARALSLDARILIMDEPTSSLTLDDTRRLFEVITSLKAKGTAIIYISHRLTEVETIADRVLVLRDGTVTGELIRHDIDRDRLVSLMIGRDVARAEAQRPSMQHKPMLDVRALRTTTYPASTVTLHVHTGEIVGLAGLVGAGRTEVLETIFGLTPPLAGDIHIDARPARIRTVLDAVNAGFALVPEDRQAHALILEDSICDNINITRLARARPWRRPRREHAHADASMNHLGIRARSTRHLVQHLSGGNQQKVVLAKWLGVEPRVLLLDEPTRGVDVGAKAEIYRIFRDLASQGLAILLASSDLEELLHIADRVLVMRDGDVTGEVPREHMTEESIMHLATRERAIA